MARLRRLGASAPAKRGPYRDEAAEKLAEIERRRRRLGVTINQLAERAGMDRSTLLRIRRTGRAFIRQLNALRMALRDIEKQHKAQRRLFAAEGE